MLFLVSSRLRVTLALSAQLGTAKDPTHTGRQILRASSRALTFLLLDTPANSSSGTLLPRASLLLVHNPADGSTGSASYTGWPKA